MLPTPVHHPGGPSCRLRGPEIPMSILLILAAALTGGIAGLLAARRFGSLMSGRGTTAALALVALAAAVGTNSSEYLVGRDVPFTAVDVIEAASYFAFGFAAAAGWRLATPPGWRWLFAVLVPIAMYEPLRIGVRLVKVLLR